MAIINFIIKNPSKVVNDSQGGDMKGWAAGIGFIILGFVIIVCKFLGKL